MGRDARVARTTETPPAPLSATTRPTWSRILRPGAIGPVTHLEEDAELREFLTSRLREELDAARLRGHSRGLDFVEQILGDLREGVVPDETSLQVLLAAYAGHPCFRARWIDPAATQHADTTSGAEISVRP